MICNFRIRVYLLSISFSLVDYIFFYFWSMYLNIIISSVVNLNILLLESLGIEDRYPDKIIFYREDRGR